MELLPEAKTHPFVKFFDYIFLCKMLICDARLSDLCISTWMSLVQEFQASCTV